MQKAAPSASTTIVPPPEGLAEGKYTAPAWAIAVIAVVLFALVAAFFVVRHRRAKRKRVYESIAPQSGPMSSRR